MRVQAKAFGRVAAGVSPIAASMRVTALLPLHGPVVASSMAELLRKYRCALHMLLCARRMHTVIPSHQRSVMLSAASGCGVEVSSDVHASSRVACDFYN